jgi:hypothetical protein
LTCAGAIDSDLSPISLSTVLLNSDHRSISKALVSLAEKGMFGLPSSPAAVASSVREKYCVAGNQDIASQSSLRERVGFEGWGLREGFIVSVEGASVKGTKGACQ